MTCKLPIYLDHNATAPVDPRVLDAMLPYLTDHFGNAASKSHVFGWKAEEAVEKGRCQLAAALNADEKEIIWTSGATESDNLAIKGAVEMYRAKGDHVITVATEHKAVLDTCKHLEKQGTRVTYLPVDDTGRIEAQQVADAMTDRTVLVSVMAANNEVGTIHPIADIGRVCKQRGVLFHCDATQALGKIPLDVEAMGIDLLSCSGHKVYGPKGVGALYVRKRGPRVRLACQMHGGGHERGMRSGTLNVPGIVGLGEAVETAVREMPEEMARLQRLRDRLTDGLMNQLDETRLNGHPTDRLANTVNISFAYVEGEGLMLSCRDIAVSSGSACTSASLEPSYVLQAMGVPDELSHSSIRFSLGRGNDEEQIDYVIERIVAAVRKLRDMSPLYEMAREGIDLSQVDWGDHDHEHE